MVYICFLDTMKPMPVGETDWCKDEFIFEDGAEFSSSRNQLIPGHSDRTAVLVMKPFLSLHQRIYHVHYNTAQQASMLMH